jgi:hypothetical protein
LATAFVTALAATAALVASNDLVKSPKKPARAVKAAASKVTASNGSELALNFMRKFYRKRSAVQSRKLVWGWLSSSERGGMLRAPNGLHRWQRFHREFINPLAPKIIMAIAREAGTLCCVC